MIKLFTQEQFDTAKATNLLPLKCEKCGKTFYWPKKEIKYAEKKRPNTGRFCSISCGRSQTTIETTCKNCGKTIKVKKSDYDESKTKNFFCSCSCSCSYHNTHKTSGFNRSKLEQYIESKLKELYPKLKILFNDRIAIGLELDIYIPSLNLAFELNGIFHYEPIYGAENFKQRQQIDENKFLLCHNNKISLCVIDTSLQRHFTEKSSQKYLQIIVDIINENLALLK